LTTARVDPAKDLEAWRAQRQYRQGRPDNRDPFERDRDRLLYSPAFRRLQAVTQVMLAADEGYLQHNRLTHSLKVAQVGRRIAENLNRTHTSQEILDAIASRGGLRADVVESAGLAHDLGHPPFGHIAETKLQRLLGQGGVRDTFEGNAQSFRIVTRLAVRQTGIRGLDLTRATLNAILKYPWLRGPKDKKWGSYASDGESFEWARDGFFGDRKRSLEADIMDWADDITYAIHDVEDFFRVGLIPLGRLRNEDDPDLSGLLERTRQKLQSEDDPRYRIKATSRDMELAWQETLGTFSMVTYDESADNRAKLSMYSGGLIGDCVQGTSLNPDATLDIPESLRVRVAFLKELTKVYVVENPALATQQQGQRRVVENLFREYQDAITAGIVSAERDAPRLVATMFPTAMAEAVASLVGSRAGDEEVGRVVADTIAGMTEGQAVRIHDRLLGIGFGSLVDPAIS
jgi:dGTPase